MFKYELHQIVFYMKYDRVHSSPILSRCIVENAKTCIKTCTDEMKRTLERFGKAGIFYTTTHGKFDEAQIFASKEDLLKSL